MSKFELNKTEIYFKGLQNDIWADDKAFIDTNLNKHVSYRVFKPYKLANKVKKRPKLFSLFFFLVIKNWFLINFIIQTKIFLSIILKFQFFRSINFNAKQTLIVATVRALDQIKKIKDQTTIPKDFLFFGTCKGVSHPGNKGIYRYLNFRILVSSYFSSLFIYKKLKLKGVDKMQTIFSQDWLHTYSILNKSENLQEIWFANHYDRWAILFSDFNCTKKVFIQHGLLNKDTNPPNLISKVNYGYLIHENQKKFIVDSVIKSDFNFETLKPSLILSEKGINDKFNVLIVGHATLHLENEYNLVRNLDKSKINLFLKPHPILTFESYIIWKDKHSYTLIEDPTFFPKVDLVISYESTLGLEYSQLGIDVIYYQEYSVQEIISIIHNKSSNY
jgi:hypothetical protein